MSFLLFFFFFQAEDGIRDVAVTGVQTCALPISFAAAQPLQQLRGAPRNCCSGWAAANVSVTSRPPAKKLALYYPAPATILYSVSTTYPIGRRILSWRSSSDRLRLYSFPRSWKTASCGFPRSYVVGGGSSHTCCDRVSCAKR